MSAPERGTSLRPIAWSLGLLYAAAALWLGWSDELASLHGDAAEYVLSARHYAPYLVHDRVAAALAAQTQFPPLYPMWLVVSGGAADLRLAHAATLLCLFAALAAFGYWLRSEGFAAGTAGLLVATVALAPGTLPQLLLLHSENLYMASSLGALALMPRLAAGDRRAAAGAALLCAAALLTRTAGLPLLPALAWAAGRAQWRSGALLAAAAAAPAALWAALHRPEHAYVQDLWPGGGPAALLARLAQTVPAIGRGFLANLAPEAWLWLAAPILVAGAAVGILRALRLRPDGIYFAGYLAMLSFWPYPDFGQRFTWVVTPLLLAYAVLGAGMATAWVRGEAFRDAARRMAAAAILLPILLRVPATAARALDPETGAEPSLRHLPEWYAPDRSHAWRDAWLHLEMERALVALGADVPADRCVLSVKPQTVAFYLGRDGYAPPAEDQPDAAFHAAVRDSGCRDFIVLRAATPQYPVVYYPLERLGDRAEVVSAYTSKRVLPGQILAARVRLREPAP